MFDALIAHIIDELAMSGDDGVSPLILTDLITDFYSANESPQNVDQAFVQFVWSQLTQLPNIQVGSLEDAPELGSLEAEEEAPQPKGKRKNKTAAKASKLGDGRKPGKSKVFVPAQEPDEAGSSNWKSMDALVARYGNKLRLAVDKETAWVSLTGSHARPSKLTPYVYAILQSIAQGRGAGVTVVDLGNEFSHDQKSIFHFVKSLLELNLIVKFRTVDKKQTTSRCIHRRYLDKSPAWQAHTATDASAAVEAAGNDSGDDQDAPKAHQFSPINMMHLNSNEPLIRSRIVSALKQRPDQRMVHSDVIHSINVTTISISVRRKLNSIILSMENEGILARVGLPSGRKTGSHVYSIALIAQPEEEEQDDEEMVDRQEDESEKDEPTSSVTHIWSTMSVQRQILDLLFSAGEVGLIMREMTDALASIETRTLEAMLSALERNSLPPHLSDYTIVSVLETFGRQKRARFFGLQGYHNRCQIDGVPTPAEQLAKVDEEAAGDFSPIESTGSYANIEELDDWGIDAARDIVNAKAAKAGKPKTTGKRGRPRKDPSELAPSSRGHKPKSIENADDAQTDGQPAKPRKPKEPKAPKAPKAPKKKKADTETPDGEPAVPKKRGRPKKDPNAPVMPYKRKTKADGTLLNPRAHEPKDVPIDQLPPSKWKSRKRKNSDTPLPERSSKRNKTVADESEAPVDSQDAEMDQTGADFAIEISPPPSAGPSKEKPLRVRSTPQTTAPEAEADDNTPALPESTPATTQAMQESAPAEPAEIPETAPPKKKRGRPRKDPNAPAQTSKAAASSASKLPVTPALYSAPGGLPPQAAPVDSPSGFPAPVHAPTPSESSKRKELSVAPQAEGSGSQSNKKARFVDYPLPQDNDVNMSQGPVETQPGMQDFMDQDLDSQDLPPVDSISANPDQTSQPSTPAPNGASAEDSGVSARMARQKKMKAPLISQTRKSHSGALREKELLEALEESGGILEEGMELRRAHYKVFTRGENAAGTTVVDRRTLEVATNALERAGSVKRVTVSVTNPLGVMKPRKLVHLISIDMKSEVMKKYIAGLSQSAQSFRMGKKPNYGTTIDATVPSEVVKPVHPRKTPAVFGRGALQYEELEGDKVQTHLAGDWRTVSQTYGFVTGKMARARLLHLALRDLIADGQSPRILKNSAPTANNAPTIIESSIVTRDLKLGDMLKLAPTTVFDDDLDDLLKSPANKDLAMDNLPKNLSRVVGAGHAKSKSRLHTLISILVNLRLIIPLEYSEESTEISRETEAGIIFYRPTDNVKEATFWTLAKSAPLYSVGSAFHKLVKVVSVDTPSSAQQYWSEFQDLCFPNLPAQTVSPAPALPDDEAEKFAPKWTGPTTMHKDFTDTRRWIGEYHLSNLQRRYLKSAAKEQENPFTNEEMQRLSEVTFADKEVISTFFSKWKWSRKKLGITKKSGRSKKKKDKKNKQPDNPAPSAQREDSESASDNDVARPQHATGAEVAKILARKGGGNDATRTAEWNQLVQQYSEDFDYVIQPGVQLDRLKSMFMRPLGVPIQELKTHFETLVKNQKRVDEVQAMVAKANASTTTGPAPSTADTQSKAATALPQVTIPVPQGEIDLAKQSAAQLLQDSREQSLAKGKRMKWTETTDDLLRDYWVVMRARCILLDVANYWKGAEELFPSSTARSLQNHFELLATKPGEDRYLAELLQMWTSVWLSIRGSPLVPEVRPQGAAGFDIAHFIVHFRKTVDKPTARLRAYVEAPENTVHNLPADVTQMQSNFTQKKPVSWREQDRWQHMWSGAAQNARQVQANYTSLSYAATDVEMDSAIALELSAARESMRACSAIKSLVATPEDRYDTEAGVQMLGAFQEPFLSGALEEMQEMGMITKVHSEHNRRVPGRNYVFASKWKQAIDSSLPNDTLQAASALDSLLQTESGKNLDWPLIPEDGEMLVLFERFSHDELDVSIDLSRLADKRDPAKNEDYVTRKLDDEDIENDVSILARDSQVPRDSGFGPITERTEMPGAGYLAAKNSWIASLPVPLQQLAGQVLLLVENGGDAGITASFLSAQFGFRNVELSQCLKDLSTSSPIFWAGYDTPRLVSTLYFSSWAVAVSDAAATKRFILPRTWIDVHGDLNDNMWQTLCKKVVTLLYLNPGCTEIYLLGLVQPLLLLPELLDILAHLHKAGVLKRQVMNDAAEAEYLFWQENVWFVDHMGCLLQDA